MSKRRSRRRILFASSDAATVTAHGGSLAKQGNDVSIARSLSAARQGLSREAFDLLLLDLELGESALPLLRELRQWQDERALPAIVLVSPKSPLLAARARQAGANRALPKPVQPAVLAACVEVVLGEAAVQQSASRERALMVSLKAVDDALARHPAAVDSAEHKAVGQLGRRLPDGPYHTGEYAAASVDDLRAASRRRPAASVRDTAEQASVDWVLFKAIEQALSLSLEQHRPLSLLMVEARPALGDEAAALLKILTPMGEAVVERARAHRLASGVTCVVLRDAAESDASRAAQLVVSGVAALEARAPVEGIHVGVATLPAHFEGSPFRLIDHARVALERARAAGRSGFYIQRVEPALSP